MTPCANCRMVHAQGPCPVISETPALCPHGVDRTLHGCDFCMSVSETPAPAGIEQSWVERLETYYDFQCGGGPLWLCVEWRQLKAKITALRQQLTETEEMSEKRRLALVNVGVAHEEQFNRAREAESSVATLTQNHEDRVFECHDLTKQVVALQLSLNTLYGSKFSDRVYHALKSRAEAAESRLASLTAGVQAVKNAERVYREAQRVTFGNVQAVHAGRCGLELMGLLEAVHALTEPQP